MELRTQHLTIPPLKYENLMSRPLFVEALQSVATEILHKMVSLKFSVPLAILLASFPAFSGSAQELETSPPDSLRRSHDGSSMVWYGILSAGATGMVYYFGEEYPDWARYYYLLGAIGATTVPGDTKPGRAFKYSTLAMFLGMAAINHHYATHPNRRKTESGWANVAGLWGGAVAISLVTVAAIEDERPHEGLAIVPYVCSQNVGLTFVIRF